MRLEYTKEQERDLRITEIYAILENNLYEDDEEIQRLNREVAKYKADAESWEKTARLLESYIGVPTEQILTDIERNKKIADFLDPTISLIGRYLQR